MTYDPSYRSPQQQIDSCNAKLRAMHENRAAFFARKEELSNQIAGARLVIADLKPHAASGDTGAQETIDHSRALIETWLQELSGLHTAPPDEDSLQAQALLRRIAELQKEQAPEQTAIVDPNDPRIIAAREHRQVATGARLAAEEATIAQLAQDAETARLAVLDGSP